MADLNKSENIAQARITLLKKLEKQLGYVFQDITLLQQALTHRSFAGPHNERLEFLGDAILDCVIAAHLFVQFARCNEGDLSRLRAHLVKQATLSEVAQSINLGNFLRLGAGELKSGGWARPSILADALEAVFAAIYIDGGFHAARNVIECLYASHIRALFADKTGKVNNGKDAKTLLQEYLQSRKLPRPCYTVLAVHGMAHKQQFEVELECRVSRSRTSLVKVRGCGTSHRAAEQVAAQHALDMLQSQSIRPASISGTNKNV